MKKIEGTARLFSVLSEPARLQILEVLRKKGGCVSSIQLATGRTQPNVSQHLKVLRDSGLVDWKRDGKKMCYSISNPKVGQLLAAVNRLGGRI